MISSRITGIRSRRSWHMAALPLGYNRIDLSFNGQEWHSRSDI